MNVAEATRLICREGIKRSGNYPVSVGIINLPVCISSVFACSNYPAGIEEKKTNLPLEGK